MNRIAADVIGLMTGDVEWFDLESRYTPKETEEFLNSQFVKFLEAHDISILLSVGIDELYFIDDFIMPLFANTSFLLKEAKRRGYIKEAV